MLWNRLSKERVSKVLQEMTRDNDTSFVTQAVLRNEGKISLISARKVDPTKVSLEQLLSRLKYCHVVMRTDRIYRDYSRVDVYFVELSPGALLLQRFGLLFLLASFALACLTVKQCFL